MKTILLALIFVISPVSGNLGAVEEAPAKGVYDPKGWLNPVRRTELETNYASALEKWGVKVFVVILSEKPDSNVVEFSKELGRRWGEDGAWGLLTHVIDDGDSPWCSGERGESLRWIETGEFEQVLANARSRAALESDAGLRVMVGARELTDELGFLAIVSKRRYQMAGEVRQRNPGSESANDGRNRSLERLLMIGLPILFALSIATIFLILRKPKSPASGFEFPETTPQRRFGGPWSGGGNVLVEFRERDKDH